MYVGAAVICNNKAQAVQYCMQSSGHNRVQIPMLHFLEVATNIVRLFSTGHGVFTSMLEVTTNIFRLFGIGHIVFTSMVKVARNIVWLFSTGHMVLTSMLKVTTLLHLRVLMLLQCWILYIRKHWTGSRKHIFGERCRTMDLLATARIDSRRTGCTQQPRN